MSVRSFLLTLAFSMAIVSPVSASPDCDFDFQCCLNHRNNDNHYDEYGLKTVAFSPVTVSLFDQFLLSPAVYTVNPPVAIWVPATKVADSPYDAIVGPTVVAPVNPDLHYVRYPIKLSGELKLPYDSRKDVFVFTEFGPVTLKLSVPQFVMIPAFEYESVGDVPIGGPPPSGYNNYICYSAMPANFMDGRGEPVHMQDRFLQNQSLTHVVASRLLCVPTERKGASAGDCSKVADIDLSYLCYDVEEALVVPDVPHYINDQFLSQYDRSVEVPSPNRYAAAVSIASRGDNLVCAPARVVQSYRNVLYSAAHRDPNALCGP